jgi:aryl-alcohol dehydrogenase-like predicted oxidoreductase
VANGQGSLSLAEARGVPMAQVAVSWVANKSPVAAPIVGATKERHIDDAVAGLELELELTTEEITKLEAANTLVRNGII